MRLYLDTSALVKLVIEESESKDLQDYLSRYSQDGAVTAELSRTELVRAVTPAGPGYVEAARTLLGSLQYVALTTTLLEVAGSLLPGAMLRSLDAVHLAAASLMTADLRAIVTYDVRMISVATQLGLATVSPGIS